MQGDRDNVCKGSATNIVLHNPMRIIYRLRTKRMDVQDMSL